MRPIAHRSFLTAAAGISMMALGLAPDACAVPLSSVHPGFDLVDIRPATFEPQVTGMEFLPDGRLLVLTNQPVFDKPTIPGTLYVVSGVDGPSAAGVTFKKVATNVFCGTGLLVHAGRVFIAEKTRLVEILGLDQEFAMDPAQAEVPGKYRTIHKYDWSGNFHEYAFGPLYRKDPDGKGYLYVALSSAWLTTGTNNQDGANKLKNRTSLLKIADDATGAAEIVLSGIRTPNGINFGPGKEIFQTDNQGNWVPAGKLNNLREGRFYGFKNTVGGLFDTEPARPPAMWLPHGEISDSPTDPTYIHEGPYAGQMLIGDVRHGGLQRCFLEKVNGEYQGAVFKFSGGFQTAINHIEIGPDKSIYLGGLGAQGASFWTWTGASGPKFWGLNKLVPNNKPVFDFLAVRSMGPDKLELQFTEPLTAASPANFEVRTFTYTPTGSYANPKKEESVRSITEATLSTEGDRVTLKVSGLALGAPAIGRVIYIKVKSAAAKSGRPLWSSEAWYTLNQFGPGTTDPIEPYESGAVALAPRKAGRADVFEAADWEGDALRINTGIEGDWELDFKDVFGRTLRTFKGNGRESRMHLPKLAYPAGLYWMVLKTSSGHFPRKIVRFR